MTMGLRAHDRLRSSDRPHQPSISPHNTKKAIVVQFIAERSLEKATACTTASTAKHAASARVATDATRRGRGAAQPWIGATVSACLDEDPELFFPIGNTGPAILQIEEAKQVCRRCDVREQCLAWALEAGQDHGVWGGLSEDERRALKRRNARARVRTA
jgi:WhiB family redox-sensing transcriptional regulator